jgi:tetratricopeptide (TPR) repeat protein
MASCSAWPGISKAPSTTIEPRFKLDPDFVTSQLGLGDTYALMGNQEQARVEYDKAIRFAHNEADRLTYGMQKAMTYVRDGNFAEADKEYLEIAETAHAKEQDLQEAQALRHMGEYHTDDNVALKHLNRAEEALSHRSTISTSDRDEERSRILRVRAVRAARAGNQQIADQALHQLETMANATRSRVIQSSYRGAAATLLMDQKKYEGGHRRPRGGSGESVHHGAPGSGVLPDPANRQAARYGSQAAREQYADYRTSAGRPGRSRQAAEYLVSPNSRSAATF